MIRPSALTVALALALVSSARAQLPAGNWQYAWGDDFSGQSLDLTKWRCNYPWGTTHNHNATMRADHAVLGDGTLSLIAERTGSGANNFVSGAISSGYNNERINGRNNATSHRDRRQTRRPPRAQKRWSTGAAVDLAGLDAGQGFRLRVAGRFTASDGGRNGLGRSFRPAGSVLPELRAVDRERPVSHSAPSAASATIRAARGLMHQDQGNALGERSKGLPALRGRNDPPPIRLDRPLSPSFLLKRWKAYETEELLPKALQYHSPFAQVFCAGKAAFQSMPSRW